MAIFFPENPWASYAAGKQARVPLLAGWNADEHRSAQFFGDLKPTKANYLARVHADFGPNASAVLKLFPANTPAEMEISAHDLASAQFITYSTWKWQNMQVETGDAPVYAYHFEQMPPTEPGRKSRGVHHGSDIQFVFETLDSQNLAWTADDRKMSCFMSSYWTNFAKTGNPNGPGLPKWPRYEQKTNYDVMHLHVGPSTEPHAAPSTNRAQYELLDRIERERRNRRTESKGREP